MKCKPRAGRASALGIALWIASGIVGPTSAGLADLESQVVEFTLDNGLRFIVLERPTAPVFSFCTQIDAGGVDEVPGVTGVAHMFEHMAFKGTRTIGTTDFASEVEALARVDADFDAWLDERRKGPDADAEQLAELRATLDASIATAQTFVKTNEFTEILERNGVSGLNAQTALDWTRYFYSLPANRLELWARLEGDRLSRPVLREFNVERNVVIEERRTRFESSPQGRLMGALFGLTFPAHPYGDGVIGHRSDLETFSRDDARRFWERYYVASNMCVVVVGGITVDDVKQMARTYFSDVPAGPRPSPVDTIEPEQTAERRITMIDDAQPTVMLNYPIPANTDPDYTAYELLGGILGGGRTSRLYTALVKEQGLCAQIFATAGFPGERYANALLVYAIVSAGKDPYDVEHEIYRLLEEDIAENPITEAELDRMLTEVKASQIRGSRTNLGLAQNLAMMQSLVGDWREFFHIEERLDAVSVDDLNRVARKTFTRAQRNVAMLVNSSDEGGE